MQIMSFQIPITFGGRIKLGCFVCQSMTKSISYLQCCSPLLATLDCQLYTVVPYDTI
jgi:hypothetical protein